ncbi:hypothetical protein CHS0354_003849 [Potamilus streckersoni]|uniref:Apple domain-containing protein n=1 Tax=Potamilus streckersoni TaxID=2493646 RepID=A0AAE0SGV3_9BIVA|nr:hypothetical protein CHS0354_003849 [Potamilus streckersoni]
MWNFFIFYTSVITSVLVNTSIGHQACPTFSPGPLTLGNLQFGIHMKTSCFRSFYGVSITECATECLLRKSRCKSINYWRISLKCQLCENMAGGDNMEPSNGGVHSNISTWSQQLFSVVFSHLPAVVQKKCVGTLKDAIRAGQPIHPTTMCVMSAAAFQWNMNMRMRNCPSTQ